MNRKVLFEAINCLSIFFVVCLSLPQSPVHAQGTHGPCPSVKVALYRKFALSDRNGVKRLYDAYANAENPGCCPQIVDPKKAREEYEKRRKILVDPVLTKMNADIKRFAEFNRVFLLDLEAPEFAEAILAYNERYDITKTLTIFLNDISDHLGEGSRLDIDPSKIGFIDTNIFFDPKRGVKGFVMPETGSVGEFCENSGKCQDVGEFIQSYAIRNGFSLIVDSSKPMSSEIQQVACIDLTNDFIATYNEFLKSKK